MKNVELMLQWKLEFGDFKPEIYSDLDGVLVDFERRAIELAGYLPEYSTDPLKKKLRGDFWKMIAIHVKKGGKFFETMDWMPDGRELWNYIAPHDPKICSATGHIVGAKDEKRAWVRREIGDDTANTAIFVRDAANKGEHAAPGRILIDDRQKALDGWIEKGGMGILHKNTKNTIAQLKELGL